MLTFRAIDVRGEPVTGRYFERYWLPVVGPTGTVLMRHLATELDRSDPYRILGHELAQMIGLGEETKRLRTTLQRLGRLGLLVPEEEGRWAVRLTVTPLTAEQVRRLPPALAEQHRQMVRMLALI